MEKTAITLMLEFLKETYTETIGEPAIRKATELLAKEASLQTPSNDKYWRERCEAAELILDHLQITKQQYDPSSQFLKEIGQWDKLKSTPIQGDKK